MHTENSIPDYRWTPVLNSDDVRELQYKETLRAWLLVNWKLVNWKEHGTRLIRVCFQEGGPPFKHRTFMCSLKIALWLALLTCTEQLPAPRSPLASLLAFDNFARELANWLPKTTEPRKSRRNESCDEIWRGTFKQRRGTEEGTRVLLGWVGYCFFSGYRSQKAHWISFSQCRNSGQSGHALMCELPSKTNALIRSETYRNVQ